MRAVEAAVVGDDGRDQRDFELGHDVQVVANGFGLATLFGVNAIALGLRGLVDIDRGKGRGGDECEHCGQNSFDHGKTSGGQAWQATLGLVTILTFVANFNAFDLIYTVKGAVAGPNYSTDILGTLFYRTFFGYQSQVASPTMGAAVATIMFLVILVGVAVYFLAVQRKLQRFAM